MQLYCCNFCEMGQEDNFNVDELLRGLFNEDASDSNVTLRSLFDKRVDELNITPTTATDIADIQYRTLNGILDGTQRKIDFTNIIKLSDFLQIPVEKCAKLYLASLEKNFPQEKPISRDKIDFIRSHFDLADLKKSGFIKSITNFSEIERKITDFFGLNSIFEYRMPLQEAAFSAGYITPKNTFSRSMWINAAKDVFKAINNPYEYDREALITYFPEIRWHSMSVDMGLNNVIRSLYKIGITVIYLPPFSSLHLRGATFSENGKPCIALTDYKGFYATIWFALIHELHHVLFDWPEIKSGNYHVSDPNSDLMPVKEKEAEADHFAREYIFSKEKSKTIRPNLSNQDYVNRFAKLNHVHPSIIYTFDAYDRGSTNRSAWARAKVMNPDESIWKGTLDYDWSNISSAKKLVETSRLKLYV